MGKTAILLNYVNGAVALVDQGNTHTETARRLCVSIKFVNDMVRLKRETGSLAPETSGQSRARQADRCKGLGGAPDRGTARSDD